MAKMISVRFTDLVKMSIVNNNILVLCLFVCLHKTVLILECTENRGEFLEKLQRARSQIKVGSSSQPILSTPTSSRLVVGNWTLSCRRAGELQIHNSDGQQATILR